MIEGSAWMGLAGGDASQGPVSRETPPAALRRAATALGIDISDAAAGRLERFERLLLERAVPAGLIAGADAGRLRARHVLDCLRAVEALGPTDRTALDLGSGAGLPGIVVAAARPTVHVGLVEPRRNRIAFLELALERLELENASLLPSRAEELHDVVDLCFARAFAPLSEAWRVALPRLSPGGRLVYFAGASRGAPEAPEAPPGASSIRLLETPLLESSGPLIIMAR